MVTSFMSFLLAAYPVLSSFGRYHLARREGRLDERASFLITTTTRH